jgi:hypothetical protein
MTGKTPDQGQRHLFVANLMESLNPKHEFCLLGNKIDWEGFEVEFAPLYSKIGQPAKPVRLMACLS